MATDTVFKPIYVQEEELEREKQQQVVLLQELEEQKAKLEQMLIEAQQEREHLKAAVTQEVPINQTEVTVHDREVTAVPPGLATEVGPSHIVLNGNSQLFDVLF